MKFEKLDTNEIESLISAIVGANQQMSLIVLDSVDSTNDYLLDLIKDYNAQQIKPKTVIIAEQQTAGKGRQGRVWVSPLGNIYLSLFWQFKASHDQMYGLSLVVGIAIARVLKTYNLADVKLKWPNDIFWQGRKLGGILIETKPNRDGVIDTVIGMGLNVIDMLEYSNQISQQYVSLESAVQHKIHRNKLAAQLLVELNKVLLAFQAYGFDHFINEWKTLDSKESVQTLAV